jgi:outer membrane protein TolC
MTTLRLTIPISGRLEAEKKLASTEHAMELARVAASEWAVRVRVRRAWAEWSALTRKLEVLRSHHERLDAIVSIVDRILAAGEMARAEARLFQIERAMHLAELRMLEAELKRSGIELKGLLGLAPEAAVEFQPALTAPELSPQEERRTLLERRSPMLLEARAEYEAAERALALEVRKQYPDLTIGPGYEREDGMDRFVFGLELPLPILNANRRGIAEARAKREESRGRFEAAYEGAVSELGAAEAALDGARAQRQVIEGELVPLVDLQYAEARKIAELGEVDTLLLLETLSRQQQARLKLIDVVAAEVLAGLRVVELVGPEERVAQMPEGAP